MKIEVYDLSGKIDINGKLENKFEDELENLPQQIQDLFKVSNTLKMVLIQIATDNGSITAVYKKIQK